MSASASAPSIVPPPLAEPSAPSAVHAGAVREGRWTRALRWFADRRHLLEMDDRLLRDVGLTREDVRRGVPFRDVAPDWLR